VLYKIRVGEERVGRWGYVIKFGLTKLLGAPPFEGGRDIIILTPCFVEKLVVNLITTLIQNYSTY
jgi:hypothetical protein